MKKKWKLLTGIIGGVAIAIGVGLWLSQDTSESPNESQTPVAHSAPEQSVDDLQIKELKEGEGHGAKHGDQLEVHYTGWLYDTTKPENKGAQFDSSREREPFKFRLGVGQVIPGWDRGLEGLKVGGVRQMLIPPELGYGARGAGSAIPPNAKLLFEVELLRLRNQ